MEIIDQLEAKLKDSLKEYVERNRNLNLNLIVKSVRLIPMSSFILINRLERSECLMNYSHIQDKQIKKTLQLHKKYVTQYYLDTF